MVLLVWRMSFVVNNRRFGAKTSNADDNNDNFKFVHTHPKSNNPTLTKMLACRISQSNNKKPYPHVASQIVAPYLTPPPSRSIDACYASLADYVCIYLLCAFLMLLLFCTTTPKHTTQQCHTNKR